MIRYQCAVAPARGTSRRLRRGDPVAGAHIPEPVAMGPRFRGDDFDKSSAQTSAAEMLREKLERQRQRALSLRLRIGLAAVAREGVIGTGIFVSPPADWATAAPPGARS